MATRNLTRRFGDLVAADGVSLCVEAGGVFGLLGANGAGKTTVIKMLTTLLPPTWGTRWGGPGHPVPGGQVRRQIGYVPQLISVEGDLTGYENLRVCARLYDVPRAGRQARIEQSLKMMGLADAGTRLVKAYSAA